MNIGHCNDACSAPRIASHRLRKVSFNPIRSAMQCRTWFWQCCTCSPRVRRPRCLARWQSAYEWQKWITLTFRQVFDAPSPSQTHPVWIFADNNAIFEYDARVNKPHLPHVALPCVAETTSLNTIPSLMRASGSLLSMALREIPVLISWRSDDASSPTVPDSLARQSCEDPRAPITRRNPEERANHRFDEG